MAPGKNGDLSLISFLRSKQLESKEKMKMKIRGRRRRGRRRKRRRRGRRRFEEKTLEEGQGSPLLEMDSPWRVMLLGLLLLGSGVGGVLVAVKECFRWGCCNWIKKE